MSCHLMSSVFFISYHFTFFIFRDILIWISLPLFICLFTFIFIHSLFNSSIHSSMYFSIYLFNFSFQSCLVSSNTKDSLIFSDLMACLDCLSLVRFLELIFQMSSLEFSPQYINWIFMNSHQNIVDEPQSSGFLTVD